MSHDLSDFLLLALPGNEAPGERLAAALGCAVQPVAVHTFPDGESLVTLPPDLIGRSVALVCTLDHPDTRLMPLLLASDGARELGARRVGLVAPYLAYMRQDKRFSPGQVVSAHTFAAVLSRHIDYLVTVDPHLHRIHSLGRLYDMPSATVASAPALAAWIGREVPRPLLIGPDSESEQWTAAVAGLLGAPWLVLEKTRRGDADVSVSTIDAAQWAGHTPVLLDDILSTGRTMIAAIGRLREAGMAAPVCVAVHAILAGDAYSAILAAGAARVVSTNTIAHASNGIDLMPLVADALRPLCGLPAGVRP
jgi:ribose-phosphate pyrophosphokinase